MSLTATPLQSVAAVGCRTKWTFRVLTSEKSGQAYFTQWVSALYVNNDYASAESQESLQTSINVRFQERSRYSESCNTWKDSDWSHDSRTR